MLSDAVSTAAISPRARASSCSAPIIAVSTPRRRCVGCTATADTPGDRNAARRPASSARTCTRGCTRPSSPRVERAPRAIELGAHPAVGPLGRARRRAEAAPVDLEHRRQLGFGDRLGPRSASARSTRAARRRVRFRASGSRSAVAGVVGRRGRRTAPTYERPANSSTSATRKMPQRPPLGKIDGEQPAEHPHAAGSASRTARTPGRAPRRHRRAAAGCRTRAGRDADAAAIAVAATIERGPPVRARREHERDARHDERAGEDPLLPRPPAQQRRDHACRSRCRPRSS